MIIKKASPDDAGAIAGMVKELTDEIMAKTDGKHFCVEVPTTMQRCRRFLEAGLYTAYLAVEEASGEAVGFVALCESHALYAEGTFGIIQELYVREGSRSQGIGGRLVDRAIGHGRDNHWTRLELCTPPVPAFDRVVTFYGRHNFAVTGGRKMRALL